ncbi:hypothetical protein U5640_36270 [Streptomyces sp. SS7]|uniref:hypothetical protein n=1 Tax=Streptomyces sp. SS7 TaxID=3108485 RepID=UPI0030EB94C2
MASITHPSQATQEQIIALLRAGKTQRQIKAQLHVGSSRVASARQAAGITPAPARARKISSEERRAAIEARYPRVAAMLRAGISHRKITAATGATAPTITSVRRALQIPVPQSSNPARTIPEGLALHTEAYGDGHARWNGPHTRGQPQLWAEGRVFSARREIFRAHHGRAPEGYVRATCEQPGCIGAEHLADDRLLAEEQLDAQFEAIFGTDAP